PMEPRFEAIGVAQRTQLPPGHDEGRLDGILGEVGVTQDPVRDPHAPVADLAGKGVEGLLVTLLRPINELSMHSYAPVRRSAMVTDQRVRASAIRQRFNLRWLTGEEGGRSVELGRSETRRDRSAAPPARDRSV